MNLPPETRKKLDKGEKIIFGDKDGVYLICNLAFYKDLIIDEIRAIKITPRE